MSEKRRKAIENRGKKGKTKLEKGRKEFRSACSPAGERIHRREKRQLSGGFGKRKRKDNF